MTKIPNKTKVKDAQKTFIVKNVAEMHHFSTDYVYKIWNGTRTNEKVFDSIMDMLEGSNLLKDEVKKLIPFN